MTNTKQLILDAAQAMVQAHGYNALSFRDVADAIGIKSSSIHYHFPTKGDLAASLAQRYTATGQAYLEEFRALPMDIAGLVACFSNIFRAALADNNRMCLIGIMAAEHADLTAGVRTEVARFNAMCTAWLVEILSVGDDASVEDIRNRAAAIFAAIQGAQLVARGRDDLAVYDQIIAAYRTSGLLP